HLRPDFHRHACQIILGGPLGTLLLEQAGKRSQKACAVCGGSFSQVPGGNKLRHQAGNCTVSKGQRVNPYLGPAAGALALGAGALLGQGCGGAGQHGRKGAMAGVGGTRASYLLLPCKVGWRPTNRLGTRVTTTPPTFPTYKI